MEIKCIHCGTVNPLHSKYCVNCGYELPKTDKEIVPENVSGEVKETKSKENIETMGFFEVIMEILNWILIFLYPFLILSVIGIIIYLYNPNNSWVSIILFIIGVILGTILAERIRRKYGTTTYMGRILGNSEFMGNDRNKSSN